MTLGAGGTPGGLGSFFAGVLLAACGTSLLIQRVTVGSGFGAAFAAHSPRLSLLLLLVGAGLLFFDGRSRVGRALTACCAAVVLVGVLMNLRSYFEPTRLFDTLLMLVLLAGGLALLGRSLTPQPPPAQAR